MYTIAILRRVLRLLVHENGCDRTMNKDIVKNTRFKQKNECVLAEITLYASVQRKRKGERSRRTNTYYGDQLLSPAPNKSAKNGRATICNL